MMINEEYSYRIKKPVEVIRSQCKHLEIIYLKREDIPKWSISNTRMLMRDFLREGRHINLWLNCKFLLRYDKTKLIKEEKNEEKICNCVGSKHFIFN